MLVALASASGFAAEVYRTVAPDGTVSYSDRPAGDNAQAVHIASEQPEDPKPLAVPRSERSAPPSSESTDSWPDVETRTPQQEAEEQAAACTAARDKLDRYWRARRIYKTTAEGEREYLDDAGIDAARERAAAEVEKACQD